MITTLNHLPPGRDHGGNTNQVEPEDVKSHEHGKILKLLTNYEAGAPRGSSKQLGLHGHGHSQTPVAKSAQTSSPARSRSYVP